MAIEYLSRIDLNLLVALQVLLEERSVTRAANRLFVTQPAMSKTLLRLRGLFDDALFTRSGRGLVPTPRALEIAHHLPGLLNEVTDLLAHQSFDPATYTGAIKLLAPEFLAVQVIPLLTRLIETQAPGICLALSNTQDGYIHQLESGEIDFVLEVEKKLPRDFIVTPLGDFTPAVWMRRGHPLAEIELTLENMLAYPFVQYYLVIAGDVSPHTESRFDKTLARMGYQRKKALVTNQLMTALDTLQSTNCLMLATMDDLKREGEFYDIVRKPYPEIFNPDPLIPAVLVQHRRTGNTPLHSWFKQELLSIVSSIRQERDRSRARPRRK
ncbi:MAG: LysR family transcriptional regulator [Porticoccaceae bacterium]